MVGVTRIRSDAPGGCPNCAAPPSGVRVLETRRRADGTLRRRKACLACGHRWTTWEGDVAARPALRGRRASPVPRPPLAGGGVVREVEVRVPVPAVVDPAGHDPGPWAVLEAAARAGQAVFAEWVPARGVWLVALTDEANPGEGATPAAAVANARHRLERLAPVVGRAQ